MINNAKIDHTFACSWGHDLKHTYSKLHGIKRVN